MCTKILTHLLQGPKNSVKFIKIQLTSHTHVLSAEGSTTIQKEFLLLCTSKSFSLLLILHYLSKKKTNSDLNTREDLRRQHSESPLTIFF